ncbi:MAG: hypothetical protein IJO28_00410 [Oscillospiraceae bacterium]|nr:hypothetical protein [Oscillospiraceae bacterium]
MHNTPDNKSIQQAKKLAESPVGQQLLSALKASAGQEFDAAQKQVQNGDFEQAKIALSKLLNTPQIQKLLKEMEAGK